MASIRLEHIEKRFGSGPPMLSGLDLEVRDGELLVLVGPSGSGKSTALRLIAGLEQPTAGRVLLDERDVTGTPAEARDLAMVFQSYALYPHKTVRENLAFGLRVRGAPKAEIARRIAAVAESLGLSALLARKPAQLSGGQRQRVALGRALVRAPQAFLFDEPLSNLDAQLRTETRAELLRLHRQLRATMVYVTHDQEEALTLGDRVAVLADGRLQQLAPPLEVYHHPANRFVAGFVGSPQMNLLSGPAVARLTSDRAGELIVGVRPADLERAPADAAPLVGEVTLVERLGDRALVHLRLAPDGTPLRWLAAEREVPPEGTQVGLSIAPERLHRFDAQTGLRRS